MSSRNSPIRVQEVRHKLSRPPELVVMQVVAGSAPDQHLTAGDLLLVSTTAQTQPDCLVVFRKGGALTLSQPGKEAICTSSAPVPALPSASAEMFGVVVGVMKRFDDA